MARKKEGKSRTAKRAGSKKLTSAEAPVRRKLTIQQRIVRTLPLAILAIVFTFILSRVGAFAELETTILDTQMRLDLPATESQVVIVDIGQEDYEEIFDAKTRPLDPSGLQRLADAIAAGGPCAVGVDIDTSFEQFNSFKVSDAMSNFVWSRSSLISNAENEKLIPLRVLGRDDPVLDSRSGLPLLGDSEKKITRYYSITNETTDGLLPLI